MLTLGSLAVHRRRISVGPTGPVDLDISDMNFTSGDVYEAIPLCGDCYIECNDPTASPPVNVKTGTSVRVIMRSGTGAIIGIFPIIGLTKRNI